MKKYILLIILPLLLSVTQLFPMDVNGIIAYPVPYNPKKGVLTVRDNNNITVNSVTLEIYDINGDPVAEKHYSGLGLTGIKWNGRNSRGSYVKPGLYILRITAEDTGSGDYGKKLIRILIDY